MRGRVQPPEGNARQRQPGAQAAVRRQQRHRRHDLMAPPRQQCQAGAHLVVALRLGQDAAAAGHHRIGSENESGGIMTRIRGQRLFGRQAQRMKPRLLALADAFVDGGGNDMCGHNAGLRQQREPARTFAGQNQFRSSGSDR